MSDYVQKHKLATGSDASEKAATRFAMALLMPADMLREDTKDMAFDVVDDDKVRQLAKRYQVSEQMMLARLQHLGIWGKMPEARKS